ncbi:hypothetical protein SPURM210S_00006 [Streptomyces purpurascens]
MPGVLPAPARTASPTGARVRIPWTGARVIVRLRRRRQLAAAAGRVGRAERRGGRSPARRWSLLPGRARPCAAEPPDLGAGTVRGVAAGARGRAAFRRGEFVCVANTTRGVGGNVPVPAGCWSRAGRSSRSTTRRRCRPTPRCGGPPRSPPDFPLNFVRPAALSGRRAFNICVARFLNLSKNLQRRRKPHGTQTPLRRRQLAAIAVVMNPTSAPASPPGTEHPLRVELRLRRPRVHHHRSRRIRIRPGLPARRAHTAASGGRRTSRSATRSPAGSATRTAFRNMVNTCHAAGVKVVADTVVKTSSGGGQRQRHRRLVITRSTTIRACLLPRPTSTTARVGWQTTRTAGTSTLRTGRPLRPRHRRGLRAHARSPGTWSDLLLLGVDGFRRSTQPSRRTWRTSSPA